MADVKCPSTRQMEAKGAEWLRIDEDEEGLRGRHLGGSEGFKTAKTFTEKIAWLFHQTDIGPSVDRDNGFESADEVTSNRMVR